MTRIEQLQKTGIGRIGTPQRGFRYKRADGGKVRAADLERIRELGIPPAWIEVAINPAPGGKLQAIGQDVAGRWQYLYHESHTRAQEFKKFQRLIKFAEALPKLRSTVSRHLRQPDLGRDRVLACMVRILSTCYLRPGSQVYASENGSYGIATLRPKHVKVKKNVVEFDFPGKSGVRQRRELKDRSVSKVVRSLLRNPGREVFKYQNGDGEFINVTNRHINEYIREIMGEKFSAKDFRTWAGTIICACALARVGTETIEKGAARKRKVVAAIKETAEMLGNTPAVCRSSYISPEIINSFEKGKIIDGYFETLEDLISYRGRKLHGAEQALLRFLKPNAKK
ncbi:MAG: DNA topoisomerase IB [Pyrinomonadaceae bacterium]|nr:DNA topoisomerase IB [Pyrinomonadaceae bacterium]